MAAPAEKTIRDLNGTWKLNKELSDSPEPTLALQNVPWAVRKLIVNTSLTLHIKQYEAAATPQGATTTTAAAAPVVHIDIDSIVSGLVRATREERQLDSQWRPHEDFIFGKCESRNFFVGKAELELEEVKRECGEGSTRGWRDEGEWIVSYVRRVDGSWTASQVWGFMDVSGERRHVRMIRVVAEGERAEIRFVHDWVGALAK